MAGNLEDSVYLQLLLLFVPLAGGLMVAWMPLSKRESFSFKSYLQRPVEYSAVFYCCALAGITIAADAINLVRGTQGLVVLGKYSLAAGFTCAHVFRYWRLSRRAKQPAE